jgi:hypothetical protein
MSHWPFRRHQRPPAPPPNGDADHAARNQATQVVQLPGDGRQPVVGEHFYQAALQQICLGQSVPTTDDPGCWEDSLSVTARLVAEHDNPHDRTAVRVEVHGASVGHLPRDDAALLHRHLITLQRAGKCAECEGRIIIANNGEYSTYLHLADLGTVVSALQFHTEEGHVPGPQPAEELSDRSRRNTAIPGISEGRFSAAELEDARLAYQTNYNHRTMNCGRGSADITTVVGTSKYQDSLRESATTPRPWRHPYDRHLPAIAVPSPEEPATVAVLIDGNMVGYLLREVAEQHCQQLHELQRAGQYLVCSALIVGGGPGKSYGVRLQIKPDIGRRWAAGARLSR